MKALVWLAIGAMTFTASIGRGDDAGVAARVNGVAISSEQVQKLAQRIAIAPDPESVNKVWNDARDQLVSYALLEQAAKADGLTVSRKELDTEWSNLKKDAGTEEQFKKTLEAQHSTEADLRKDLERSLLIQKVLDRRIKIKVTPAAIEAYYKENPGDFEHGELVQASHILFRTTAADPAAARQRAEKTLALLKGGEDFATLARKVSDDELTAKKGGDLGFFPQRPTPIAEAAFKLKVGEISNIVESPYGLHIVKVTATKPSGKTPLAEAKPVIKEMLEEDQRDEQEEAFIERLRSKAKIEILQDKPADAQQS